MPKIFISYRRADSGYAAVAIYEKLKTRYGPESVLFDVDSIPFGVDFVDYLDEQVGQCDVLLAVIGDRWLSARSDDGTPRLDDPQDFVRIEIASALGRGIPVIPVLIESASVPKAEDLPAELRPLVRRQAAEVRPGRDYQNHLELLVRGLDRVFSQVLAGRCQEGEPKRRGQAGTAETPHVEKTHSVLRNEQTPLPAAPGVDSAMPTPRDRRLAGRAGDVLPEKPAVVQPDLPRTTPTALVIESIGMHLLPIPAGEFWMGSPESDPDASADEKPRHRVRITKPFYLGIYPVTQSQYEAVMGANPSKFRGEGNRPVESVSWDEANTFCRKLSETVRGLTEDQFFRLPTEAEWEYACRAGMTTRYYFGDDATAMGEYVWFRGNSGGTTHPVGEKKPNAWGLYDMHGNVWEWCADWYDAEYYGASPVDDPTGPTGGSSRVYRGGSWYDDGAWFCGAACRSWDEPSARFRSLGFRLARSVSSSP